MTLRRSRPAVPLVVPTTHGWWLLALALALGVSWRLTDLDLVRSTAVLTHRLIPAERHVSPARTHEAAAQALARVVSATAVPGRR